MADFTTLESSQESSEPVELYTIVIGSITERWTSAEDDFPSGGNTFLATGVTRSNIVSGGEEQRNAIVVLTVPGNNSVAVRYISSVPGITTSVTIQRVQRQDTGFEVKTIYLGRISKVSFRKAGREGFISVIPLLSATNRQVPRRTFMSLCNHVLYDSRCGISDTDTNFVLFSVPVTDVTDNTITVVGAGDKGDGAYTGGFARNSNASDQRMILAQTGDVLTLNLPFADSVLGQSIDIFVGCDLTIAICDSTFSNVINFGGFAFVPTRDIFAVGIST